MEGLTTKQARNLLNTHGHNILPRATPPSLLWIFIKQFFNPLIYILIVAAIISIFLGEVPTGIFIFILLCINSTIGAIQERSAQKAVISLQNFMPNYTQVLRDGTVSRINSEELVPGDIIFLESGNKIPADAILLEANNLNINESLLTGESMPVSKDITKKNNKLFAGTLVAKGRAKAQILSTGLNTKLGEIAQSVTKSNIVQSPLIKRIEKFTIYLSTATVIFIIVFSIFALMSGEEFAQIFTLAIALAVAAIPEGLPTSITVVLAVGVYRMAKSNVIVRKLLAVESLGSCTYIVSDKTGTLTKNKLTIETIILPDNKEFSNHSHNSSEKDESSFRNPNKALQDLILAGSLANEAHQNAEEVSGDVVDVAFLTLGKKINISKNNLSTQYKLYKFIPYESENKFSAGIYTTNNKKIIFAKGGYETILQMCKNMKIGNKTLKLDKKQIVNQVEKLAKLGYKVIALAQGEYTHKEKTHSKKLKNLSFLGIVGITDPLRPEAKNSIDQIAKAGVKTVMVTGDHPITAFTIAQRLGMNINKKDIVTGADLKSATQKGEQAVKKLIENKKVFAHIEPLQKQVIVQALMDMGHYVAVTGDGVNDAPALKYANIGVAMGKNGTDIARDSADIILTDDNFASIVKGIMHGRVVYNNIRKVIFVLLSTGIAEIFLFLLALLFNTPMPLLAIQLLWLNIIIHGIQDEAFGFEPVEGDELTSSPRKPDEQIFDRFMTGRIFSASIYIGGICFLAFYFFLNNGYGIEKARSFTLLLMVLFGNIQALISKSETKFITKINLLDNKVLFFSIIISQMIHITSMYTPYLQGLFHVHPVGIKEWTILLAIASSLFFAEAIYRKLYHKFFNYTTSQE
ncbi:MAG: HAD-IC family P-type ATPase [Rickettsiales bacterium]|nr:HAD-IC family P-type ATPase [Rickettsiales bacterium]